MTTHSLKLAAAVAFLLLPASAFAQRDAQRARTYARYDSSFVDQALQPVQDSAQTFAKHLYPPELVMQNQARIKVTEAQRNAILAEIYKLQATAAQVQWRVADESEKLNELLARETVPEADVLAQAERMMGFEVAVKRAQLSMLIRIRNILTPEQRGMLQELRKRE